MTASLQVSHLTKRFGGLTAVRDISFSIAPSEVVGILGPNGAGKTTLYNLLTGFISFDEGSILFNDTSLQGIPPHRIAQMGISRTFQLCRPFVGMTVEENVRVGGLSRPAAPEGRAAHALRLLDEVGLAHKAHEPVEVLSYGDQRRLEIARALASSPKMLLLDEPFAGLGSGEIAELSALIRKIHGSTQVTILLIEHKLHEFMKLVDRVIALDFGELIADDIPERIVKHPKVIEAYIGSTSDAEDFV